MSDQAKVCVSAYVYIYIILYYKGHSCKAEQGQCYATDPTCKEIWKLLV